MDILFQSNLIWAPLVTTLKLASITSFFLLIIGLPIAYWLAFSMSKLKIIVDVLVAMPLILPPTVLGFYLLLAFSPNSALGVLLNTYFGVQLAFSFTGIVIGSMIYSLPFMVQPIRNAFHAMPKSYFEMASILGKNKFQIAKYILFPNTKKAIISAVTLTFAHTIGEFGVVLMLGGSIPNKTKVASIAIYENVEALEYNLAHQHAIILLIVSFCILLAVYYYNASNRISTLYLPK